MKASPAKRELLRLLADGLTVDEMAARTYRSTSTIKSYLDDLRTAWGANNSTQLVAIAYESGILQPCSQADAYSAGWHAACEELARALDGVRSFVVDNGKPPADTAADR